MKSGLLGAGWERVGCMAWKREKLLIIDGYNVLRSGSRYARIAGDDHTDDTFNAARESLVNDVAAYAGSEARAVIVYDGANNEYSDGSVETIGGVQVVFSAAGQSADKVIEKLARDARNRNVETLVVTSDAAIQDAVFGEGVDRMSAEGFSREIEESYADALADEKPVVARKNTIAERIDEETLAKLEDIRDGGTG